MDLETFLHVLITSHCDGSGNKTGNRHRSPAYTHRIRLQILVIFHLVWMQSTVKKKRRSLSSVFLKIIRPFPSSSGTTRPSVVHQPCFIPFNNVWQVFPDSKIWRFLMTAICSSSSLYMIIKSYLNPWFIAWIPRELWQSCNFSMDVLGEPCFTRFVCAFPGLQHDSTCRLWNITSTACVMINSLN